MQNSKSLDRFKLKFSLSLEFIECKNLNKTELQLRENINKYFKEFYNFLNDANTCNIIDCEYLVNYNDFVIFLNNNQIEFDELEFELLLKKLKENVSNPKIKEINCKYIIDILDKNIKDNLNSKNKLYKNSPSSSSNKIENDEMYYNPNEDILNLLKDYNSKHTNNCNSYLNTIEKLNRYLIDNFINLNEFLGNYIMYISPNKSTSSANDLSYPVIHINTFIIILQEKKIINRITRNEVYHLIENYNFDLVNMLKHFKLYYNNNLESNYKNLLENSNINTYGLLSYNSICKSLSIPDISINDKIFFNNFVNYLKKFNLEFNTVMFMLQNNIEVLNTDCLYNNNNYELYNMIDFNNLNHSKNFFNDNKNKLKSIIKEENFLQFLYSRSISFNDIPNMIKLTKKKNIGDIYNNNQFEIDYYIGLDYLYSILNRLITQSIEFKIDNNLNYLKLDVNKYHSDSSLNNINYKLCKENHFEINKSNKYNNNSINNKMNNNVELINNLNINGQYTNRYQKEKNDIYKQSNINIHSMYTHRNAKAMQNNIKNINCFDIDRVYNPKNNIEPNCNIECTNDFKIDSLYINKNNNNNTFNNIEQANSIYLNNDYSRRNFKLNNNNNNNIELSNNLYLNRKYSNRYNRFFKNDIQYLNFNIDNQYTHRNNKVYNIEPTLNVEIKNNCKTNSSNNTKYFRSNNLLINNEEAFTINYNPNIYNNSSNYINIQSNYLIDVNRHNSIDSCGSLKDNNAYVNQEANIEDNLDKTNQSLFNANDNNIEIRSSEENSGKLSNEFYLI